MSKLIKNENTTQSLKKVTVLPVKDMVFFPNTIAPFFIGKTSSISAIKNAIEKNENVLVVYENENNNDDEIIAWDNFAKIGVYSQIIQSVKLMDGTFKIVLDGLCRASVNNYKEVNDEYFVCDINIQEKSNQSINDDYELEALTRHISENLYGLSHITKGISSDNIKNILQIKNCETFIDIISANLQISNEKKLELLEEFEIKTRMEKLLNIIISEKEIVRIERDIQDKVRKSIDKGQKEYYITEQIKILKKELGENDSQGDAIEKYEEELKDNRFPKHAKERIEEEIKRLKTMSNNSSETAIIRSYLDLIIALPWNKHSRLQSSITNAKTILNKSHYGMEKTKQRVIESIAVQMKTGKVNKEIICLYGPPGVGKTSLAKSIAEATGREYIKIALGGVHDEGEIRGHRRTYIGAMAGKIISSLKKAKTNNPLILLDEIDKLTSDNRGDPASALLEVLDPEQNKQFVDHYLDLEYDLSNVMFIATANSLQISPPLLDRMEVIKVPSYLEQEKFVIAKDYIIAKAMKHTGLTKKELIIEDEAIHDIIRYYTREAGTRELDRKITKLCRSVVVKKLEEKKVKKTTITSENLPSYLGIRKYTHTNQRESEVGVVNGLAYTEVGGDILFIEAVKIANGKGEIKSTGKLGDVMKESVQIAHSFCKANAEKLGISIEDLNTHDVHLHVPEGATPKDGPSAGITIVMAITSLFTNKICPSEIAMTGEVSLKGDVMPIGGLREKLTSAVRSEIKTVLIPEKNKKDLDEIPDYIKEKLNIKAYTKVLDAVKENLL
ncbi:MAG: hypothetical protein RL208_98 [Pseudomonadota bacterium]|jgi:ATP-dependent Lon protease